MDSITHMALGACIGEVVAGRKLGKKSLFLGAVANSLPDVDALASLWLPPDQNLLVHRGITHSFLFVALASPLLAWGARRYFKYVDMGFGSWTFFWALQLLVHVLLDAFNAYGTGWWEPFNPVRISFHVLFVADPFFSLVPAAAFFILFLVHKGHTARIPFAITALAWSLLYLGYGLYNKSKADAAVQAALRRQHLHPLRYLSTPTPLNTWLWYTIAEADSGYYISYRSVFDGDAAVQFHYFPRNAQLLPAVPPGRELANLLRFSQGYYTIDSSGEGLVFNDLRFGQVAGWYQPGAPFSFHYHLHRPGNALVLQRGRFTGWDMAVLRSMIQRIRGAE